MAQRITVDQLLQQQRMLAEQARAIHRAYERRPMPTAQVERLRDLLDRFDHLRYSAEQLTAKHGD